MILPKDPASVTTAESEAATGTARIAPLPAFVRSLLRIPLFHKLLIANVAVVAGAVAATAWLLLARPPGDSILSGGVAWVLAGGVVLLGAVAANGLILRVALSPLDGLERTARAVSDGDTTVRVTPSPVADRRLERLVTTFNDMLHRTEAYQRRLKQLAARALAAQEEERKRVARELHDDTGQRLAAALLRLGVLRSRVEDPDAIEAGLDGLRDDLAEAIEAVRAFARDLRPPALSELGLIPAIDAYLRAVRERTSLQVELVPPRRDPGLEPEVELVVYRIVQEAVSNAVRHADATTVRVDVDVDDLELRLSVEDDGRGFRPAEILQRRGEGLGLFGMEERAAYVGGRLRVESEPGSGTRIAVHIPRRHTHLESSGRSEPASPQVRAPATARS